MPPSVAVVGLGRIGLPLALSFADRGLDVVGVDKVPAALQSISSGRMPFEEPGTQELLERVLPSGRLRLTHRIEEAAGCEHIVLTLGTPAFSHIEIDISDIRHVTDDLLPLLREGHSLILRSTVAPGTTDWLAGYIEQRRGFTAGEDIFVSHVPERIAANRFLEEISTLPCIVGGVGTGSGDKAAELFDVFGTEIVQTTPVQAELAKIWTNIFRYATFALPNLLMMNCEQYGANVFEVIDLINRDYPRGGIGQPGLTAGTCLRKDFAFSEEKSNAPGMLLGVSRVHESVPLFLIDGVKRRLQGSLRERKVAVLGLAFKRDTDDERDSLSHKLIRLLERELADVAVHDWMREGCEIHTGDLRDYDEARQAIQGCSHVIHLAAIVGGIANFHKLPHTLTEVNNALYNAVVRAALDHDVQRFTYVSSSMVFERATEYPTTEEHIWECPIPRSAYGFSKLTGEVYVRAAHDEHGLPYTICRPFNAYGPGEMPEDEPGIAHMVPDVIKKCLTLPEGAPLPIFGDGTQTRTLTHVDDIADGIVTAMASPAGLREDFNISAADERTVAELARVIWEACGRDPADLRLEHLPSFEVDVVRRWPSVEKAKRLLGWQARIGVHEGIAQTVDWLRESLPEPSP